jgi:hypothetical protein
MDVDVMLAPLYELAALHLTKKQGRLLAGPAHRADTSDGVGGDMRELNNPPDPRRLGGGPKRLAQLSGWPTNMGLVTVATLATIAPGPDNIEGKRAGFGSRPACDVSLMPIGAHRATAGRSRPQGVGRFSFRPRRTLRARRSRAASRYSSSMCCLPSIAVESRSM